MTAGWHAAGLVTLGLAAGAASAAQSAGVELKTLTYAVRGGKDLQLDLYIPTNTGGARLPVIVFLHGGGWSGGTRTTGPDFRRFFAQDGFAMASIEYRLTPEITFPSNVEDVKTAVRWLRANADVHRLDPNRICLWGTSAGGHLAAVAALAPKGTFEGDDHLTQSSAAQCVLDAYGPTKFDVMDAQTSEEQATLQPQAPALLNAAPMPGAPGGPGRRGGAAMQHELPTSPESRLVGAALQSVPERVRAASPLSYVRAGAPPFLIMHGLADNSVPHGQSLLLYEALAAAGNEVTLRLVDGLPHTFFNRTDLDDIAGPFRMTVRERARGAAERRTEDRAGVFAVARAFFQKHLGRSPQKEGRASARPRWAG